ncbi:unnamed protein product [Rotaria sordida]|uniref:Uncharacterized protein n=1 Tax=Rotaria sordida TaxID=392033 RepID=A0A815QJN4_9BILA|nr:unnamed protein product [Rotaria sordida]CAF4108580.1 unnamed protein product [Rotaria sordida]
MPLKPYQIYTIDETTSADLVEKLIVQAKRTFIVTLFPYDDDQFHTHYLQIELIQNKRSILINIEFFLGHNLLLPQIDRLLSAIFHPSKLIQIWGKLSNRFTYDYDFNLIYSQQNNIHTCHFINIQHDFQIWYKNTFQNKINDDQTFDFHKIDGNGQLRLRSYCPLNCSSDDQWSLQDAIKDTFKENLDHTNFHIYKCIAITKLATVINEKWNYANIQDYIKINHLKQKNE